MSLPPAPPPPPGGTQVITEGDVGDKFYIIKEGEATVVAGSKEVNRLFKADFFGEQALLKDEPRWVDVWVGGGRVIGPPRYCLGGGGGFSAGSAEVMSEVMCEVMSEKRP